MTLEVYPTPDRFLLSFIYMRLIITLKMYLKPASFTLTHFQMEQNLLDAYALIKHTIDFQSVLKCASLHWKSRLKNYKKQKL
jgi:hypothetical protein